MGIEIKPWDPETHNDDIVKSIRYEASSDYQKHIPDEIKADAKKTLEVLNNYRPAWNEFVGAILNKIGLVIARNNSWQNPLAMYKKGLLEYGDTVEELQVGLIRSYAFDPRREYGEKALFGKHVPDVQSSYHTANREVIIPLTIQRATLQRAFLSPTGLSEFIMSLMAAANTRDNLEEYLATVNLFRLYHEADGFFKANVADVASKDSTRDDARSALRTMREFAETLPFLSTHFNAAKMPVSANPEDMILITTPQFKSGLDVNALAELFNVNYAEVPYRTHVVPQHDLNIPGGQGILTTKDFFQIYDTYFATDSQPNPAGRYENFFLHHDQIISASRFVPAILFTTGDGDVIEISDKPVTGVNDIVIRDNTGNTVTNVERGESYMVEAGAITEGDNTATVLYLDGKESNFTYLAQTGTFHVSIDEKATELVLKAKAEDGDFEKTRTVTVVGDRVDFWPNPGVAPDEDKDGLTEVTPEALVMDSENKVTIPHVTGVQYNKAGSPVNNGTVHTIAAETVFTATARPKHEIAAGATATWTFNV